MDQTRSSAPVSAQADFVVAAPARETWTVLADIASWPTWNPAVRHAVCDVDVLEVGTRFRFATEIGTFKCRVTRVDAPRLFAWKGRVLMIGERQVWELAPNPAGTHVMVRAEMTGLVARLLRRRLTDRLQNVLDGLVRLLCLEVEARVIEERETESRAAEAAGRDLPGRDLPRG
jgi:uncharacterized protein YndB with AHSA1/START domain